MCAGQGERAQRGRASGALWDWDIGGGIVTGGHTERSEETHTGARPQAKPLANLATPAPKEPTLQGQPGPLGEGLVRWATRPPSCATHHGHSSALLSPASPHSLCNHSGPTSSSWAPSPSPQFLRAVPAG